MSKVVFYNGTIVTINANDEVIENGYIVVEEGKIVEVGSGEPPNKDKETYVNLQGKWVLPGLINTHGHTGMTLLRGHADDLPLQQWLETKIWPAEAKLNKGSVAAGSSLAILEMIKSGTTTFLDMYHLHLPMVAQLVNQAGLRAVLTRGMIGLCPKEEQQAKLAEAVAFAKQWQGEADGRITTMLSPHAPYTCPPEFIAEVVAEAKCLDIPVHIHLAETAGEVERHQARYNRRPIHHMNELGLFEGKALIAHAVHLDTDEIELLAAKDVFVSHNPVSNLKLGSGVAKVAAMVNAGITVSLGTDSVASNNNLDLFEEMRMAALIHKGVLQDSTIVPARLALRMATRNGARSLNNPDIGSLEKGKAADFITIDPQRAHFQPLTHVTSHLVYTATGADVSDVYVNGKAIMKNRECLTIDEEKILFEANQHYRTLVMNH